MGCLKLTYRSETPTLKVVRNTLKESEKPCAGAYRFGFQGQEKDDEITGVTGSHLNFKYRMYDSRIGRFFKTDPLAAKYPFYSPYAFSGNRVIDSYELEGLEPVHRMEGLYMAKAFGYITQQDIDNATQVSMSQVHFMLDVMGMAPVVGEVADLINGGIYTIEGDGLNASLSYAGAIPFLGWGATGAKWAGKAMKLADGSATFLQWTKKANGLIDFGSSTQLRKVLNLTDGTKQAHHIVPWSLRNNSVVQKAAEAGFHMNDEINGVALKTFRKATGDGVHASHKAYNDYIEGQINDWATNTMKGKYSADQAKEFIDGLIKDTRELIESNPDVKINDLFK